MPVYKTSDELYGCLTLLFDRIRELGPGATQQLLASRLVIRFLIASPPAQVLIDGRGNPAKVTFGQSSIRPVLRVELSADSLHSILLKELSLRKALASGAMKVHGPIWRVVVLEELLHHMQDLYPQVLRECGLVS
jgi:hypothetical protein